MSKKNSTTKNFSAENISVSLLQTNTTYTNTEKQFSSVKKGEKIDGEHQEQTFSERGQQVKPTPSVMRR